MKGNISLKDFILGIKKELQEASNEGSAQPYLELNQVELEAEFGLEISGSVEGGFNLFVKAKATAETGASQSHKVKLIFSPIKGSNKLDNEYRKLLDNVRKTLRSTNPIGSKAVEEPGCGYTFDTIKIGEFAVENDASKADELRGSRGSGEDEK